MTESGQVSASASLTWHGTAFVCLSSRSLAIRAGVRERKMSGKVISCDFKAACSFMANRECPPRSKKSSSAPTASPRTSSKARATSFCKALPWSFVPPFCCGLGRLSHSAWSLARSTLPLLVSGRAGMQRQTSGTM